MIEQPLVLRPHHVDILSTWLDVTSPEKPVYEQPQKLLHFFWDNVEKAAEFFRYLVSHRETSIVVSVQPDSICKICPGYNPDTNSCNRYYDDENTTIQPEDLRVQKDRDSVAHYNLGNLRTIDDIFQRKHWKSQR